MREIRPAAFLLLLLGCLPAAAGQESVYEHRVYNTVHSGKTPPRIDGDLSDPCWEQVEWGADFIQWEPSEGDPPSQPTAFKILYDDHALYVAYRAYDSEPELIVRHLARRDYFPGDWVEINIDSYFDGRTAFSFTASASGTRGDEFVSNDGDVWDGNWDPVWEFETKLDEEGWTAEARIPLSQLRFADKEEHVWGIQIQRRLFRKEERSLWQPKSKDEAGWVSRFGELRGIRGIPPAHRMELLPYTVAKVDRFKKTPGDPFNDGSRSDLSSGLDGKIGVTTDLTLDLTVNPDFGQVEADPSEVNLTAFETFFSEKRPFFIEGSNIIDFGISPSIAGGSHTQDNLFYSRRIGRPPRHRPDLGDGEYAEVPDETSILGALKLTGKTRQGLSVGILESMTAEESATMERFGSERKETVEPFSNFFVGRLQKDFERGRTRIGGMVTAVNRRLDAEHLEFNHASAYSGGVDFLHYWSDRSWYVAATAAASRVEGEETALLETQTSSARYYQRPDNDYEDVDSTRTALGGHAGSFRVSKISGRGNVRFETGAAWRSPGFEVNDVGFMRRADQINQFTWFGYSLRRPFSIFRRMDINGNQWVDWDFGGTTLSKRFNVNLSATFKNQWSAGAEANRETEFISNTALRGGPSSKWPGNWSASFWVDSDRRRFITHDFGAYYGWGDEGSHETWEAWVSLSFRPTNAVLVSVNPFYNESRADLQFVGIRPLGDSERYLFGELDQKTTGFTVRMDYTITPNLTVQYYGAPFLSAGSYGRFKRITDARADEYLDRFHAFSNEEIAYDSGEGVYAIDEDSNGEVDYSISDPDFNFRDFNSNLVFRWEFRPGSTLFLVWSQARSGFDPDGRFSYGDDLDSLFDVYPSNTFLVKVNKWFSL